jgi:CRISPR system Cascade subunit CasE
MYLARGFLNPTSPAVRGDLADPVSLHRTVMQAFPGDAGASARAVHAVLHRTDADARRGRLVLLVQSATRPDFSRLPPNYFLDLSDYFDWTSGGASENPAVREVSGERANVRAGERFAFRLQANTTRKIDTKTGPDGSRRHGRRVPVKGDEGRIAWLERRAASSGFRVEDVRITELRPRSSRLRQITLGGSVFEGLLTVTDADAFRRSVAHGVGPGKAFGFGLLSFQRAR